MFHLSNGLYFKRAPSGVQIVYRPVRMNKPPEPEGSFTEETLLDITVTNDEFASVIASVSARGEDLGTYNEALRLLTKPAASC